MWRNVIPSSSVEFCHGFLCGSESFCSIPSVVPVQRRRPFLWQSSTAMGSRVLPCYFEVQRQTSEAAIPKLILLWVKRKDAAFVILWMMQIFARFEGLPIPRHRHC